MSVVFNALFRLTTSCSFLELLAKNLDIAKFKSKFWSFKIVWACPLNISTDLIRNARFPSFRCRSSVAVSPFCRCKIPLFCKNYVRKFRSVTAMSRKNVRNGSGVRKRQRQRRNGNRTATEWWKPGITLHRTPCVKFWDGSSIDHEDTSEFSRNFWQVCG